MCVYTEVRHNLFKKHPLDDFPKLVKRLFLSWVIFLKSKPDHEKLRLISSDKMFESIEM